MKKNIFKNFISLAKKTAKKNLFITHTGENYYISDGCWIAKMPARIYDEEIMPALFYELQEGEAITINKGKKEKDHKSADWIKKFCDKYTGDKTGARLPFSMDAPDGNTWAIIKAGEELVVLNKNFVDAVPAWCDNITAKNAISPVIFSGWAGDVEFYILPINAGDVKARIKAALE